MKKSKLNLVSLLKLISTVRLLHGGLGIGLDRLAMVMLHAESLRDVTAFPKVQNASELMSECPSPVDKESLDVLGIDVVKKETNEK